jgi:hypothetical protein
MDVTLMLKKTYEIGRESGDRYKSATRVSFVRALVLVRRQGRPKHFPQPGEMLRQEMN